MTLRLGAVRLEFTAEEFGQLAGLIAEALKRFEVTAGDVRMADSVWLKH